MNARSEDRPRRGGQRLLRVGEELRHALAAIVQKGELKDPELSGRAITVTEVRVAPDLKSAQVFVTPLGGGDPAALVKALTRAQSFLRARLADAVRLKFAPRLDFRFDPRFDASTEVEALLKSEAVRRDLGSSGSDGA